MVTIGIWQQSLIPAGSFYISHDAEKTEQKSSQRLGRKSAVNGQDMTRCHASAVPGNVEQTPPNMMVWLYDMYSMVCSWLASIITFVVSLVFYVFVVCNMLLALFSWVIVGPLDPRVGCVFPSTIPRRLRQDVQLLENYLNKEDAHLDVSSSRKNLIWHERKLVVPVNACRMKLKCTVCTIFWHIETSSNIINNI